MLPSFLAMQQRLCRAVNYLGGRGASWHARLQTSSDWYVQLFRSSFHGSTRPSSVVQVPFAVIVIIPFMELALPILLKLFPNMLVLSQFRPTILYLLLSPAEHV